MDSDSTRRQQGILQTIGPGVMYAGAAIGVSHLVQATRAGAGWGFALVWIVLLVHVFKYPFFEFGHRYTAATGESLLHAYDRIGRWAIIGYLLLVCGLSIPTGAVLTIVTAGMASQVLPVGWSMTIWILIMLGATVGVLAAGGYPLLDKLMKIMMVFLAFATVIAVIAAALHGQMAPPDIQTPPIWDAAGVAFLIALMGWMPTPVDCSAWPSLWMIERTKETGHKPTLGQAMFDFRLGYVATLVMAVAFLSLGALVMYGTGEKLAESGPAFAAQLVGMYTRSLGEWSRPVIVAAAFVTMLSTMLTVFDAYPRVLRACCLVAWPSIGRFSSSIPYWIFMGAMIVGALLIFECLTSHMRTLVDFVTTLAFVSAPVAAYLNWRAIRLDVVPRKMRPSGWLHVLSIAGLAFLICFALWFLKTEFAG